MSKRPAQVAGARAREQAPPASGYYALVVPGIEALAAELLTSAGAHSISTLSAFDRRESLLRFEVDRLKSTLDVGVLEDIFRVIAEIATPRAPAAIGRAVTKEALDAALLEHHALATKRRGRSYRVVVRVAGKQPFRRQDVDAALARAVGSLLPHWVLTSEAAAIEVWAHVVGARTIIGLRLTGDEFAQRRYKRAHLVASLKPTVARALVRWSQPKPDDVMLDPMAGAGTILRERAEAARANLIAGGDIDREALAAARTNAGKRVALALWDTERLPLRSESIDAVVTNPPYGRQHEAVAGVERLYRRMLREVVRVLRSSGRAVVLTGEPAALSRVLPPKLIVRAKHRLLLRGLPVTAFVLVKR